MVILVGKSGVGKSCITRRFIEDKYSPDIDSTFGASFMEKVHRYGEGQAVKFQIWDTAGQEKFQAITRIYFKDSRVALAVYDIADKDSFKALEHWIKEIKENAPKNVMIVLVGNKNDLIDSEQVRYEESKDFAKKIDARLFLVSAKDGKGITVAT